MASLISSVFFGGGTPSLMPTKIMSSLITEAEKLFGFMADIEITAEANPTSVETAKLQGFQQAGVNRVSLGIQSLDDTALSFPKGVVILPMKRLRRLSFHENSSIGFQLI